MADYYAAAAVLGVREPKQLLPKAEWAARRALEMDPLEAGAHASLAVVEAIYHCNWDAAATHFRRMLENEAHFQPYLFVLAAGLHDAPQGASAPALVYRAVAQYLDGDSFGAYRLAQSAAQMQSRYWPAILVQSLADGISEPPLGLLWSQGVFARRGPEQAQSVLDGLTVQRQSRYVPSSLFATAFLTLGNLEKAFHALERAAAERDPFLPLILMDPALEPLRSETALAAVLRTCGLTQAPVKSIATSRLM
jgi:hypothetical protein